MVLNSVTPHLAYGKCDVCAGTGKVSGQKCAICTGYGMWEFIIDDNHQAVEFLNDLTADVSDRAKEICGRRIHSIPIEYFNQFLKYLNTNATQEMYDKIHQLGYKRWGWAWVHTVRFAIALCKLNNLNPHEYAFAISQLAWNWLEQEKQSRVMVGEIRLEASPEKNSKKDDVPVDIPTDL